jgi:hypothetical protein
VIHETSHYDTTASFAGFSGLCLDGLYSSSDIQSNIRRINASA